MTIDKKPSQSIGRYKRSIVLIAAVLTLYPVLAYYGPRNDRAEFYPFFNWSLFTHASDSRSDIVMFVHSLNGVDFEEPVLLFEMEQDFLSVRNRDASLVKFLDDYAVAHWRGDAVQLAQIEAAMLNRYLVEADQITYELAQIKYHPVERYRTGKIDEVSRILFKEHQS